MTPPLPPPVRSGPARRLSDGMPVVERYVVREMSASTAVIDTRPRIETIIAHVGLRADAEKIVRALNDSEGAVERIEKLEALLSQAYRVVGSDLASDIDAALNDAFPSTTSGGQ